MRSLGVVLFLGFDLVLPLLIISGALACDIENST
jgi:hypothetical protein